VAAGEVAREETQQQQKKQHVAAAVARIFVRYQVGVLGDLDLVA